MSKVNTTRNDAQSVLTVNKANALALIQDTGRYGQQHKGITEGGAIDMHAMLWANKLLGLPNNSSVIEIAVGLFHIKFNQACRIAITGADLNCQLNGNPCPLWQTLNICQKDELYFTTPVSGLRAYLAIDGKMLIDNTLGSTSTVIREQLGGINGKALSKGDQLYYRLNKTTETNTRTMPQQYMPNYQQTLVVDVIPCYQFSAFSEYAVQQFTNNEYTIQANSNRMAYQLSGTKIDSPQQQLTSEGIAYGSIQIPANGQPIILLNDRQTIGGYPKIGCITRLSGYQLAQRNAKHSVRFKFVTRKQAQVKLMEFKHFFCLNTFPV